MRYQNLIVIALAIVCLVPALSSGQLKSSVINGSIQIEDNPLFFNAKKYIGVADSLNNRITKHPTDTTALFELALIIDLSNNVMSKPFPGDKIAYLSLLRADTLVNQATKLGMHNRKLTILRAQIYRDLTFRFADDQSWKFNNDEISRRRALFNNYKTLANKMYSDLEVEDKANASDYGKLIVKTEYPIK